MFFIANWNLEGLKDGAIKVGEIIEAELEEVVHLVAAEFGGLVGHTPDAVLTPATPDEETAAAVTGESAVPGGDVDLTKLKKEDLIAHAAEHHDLEVDPKLKKEEIIGQITEARAAVTGESTVPETTTEQPQS